MMQALLDTNILIYLLEHDKKTIEFLKGFGECVFLISIISWIETVAGSFHHRKQIAQVTADLGDFIRIPLHDGIATKAVHLLQKNFKKGGKPHFQDMLIAATALANHLPLITNNPKDFRNIRHLKVIAPSTK